MGRKATHITLIANGLSQDFGVGHAERILRMKNNGGWQLPKDSKYYLDETHGLRRIKNTGAPTKA